MNLRQVKTKVKSVTNVKKITKAMQLVSAIKMKKSQQVAIEGRPYSNTLEEIIQKVLPSVNVEESPLLAVHGSNNKELVIFISSNKGLCGAFNVNLFRFITKHTEILNTDFITVGKKGALFVGSMKAKIIADYSSNNPIAELSAVFDLALQEFLKGNYAKVSLVYNKFVSTLRSDAVKGQLLPIVQQEIETKNEKDATDYLVEPTRSELLQYLLQSYVEEKVRVAFLNSEAAEHSARMIAMKNATDNATDLILDFTSLGNKLRQSKITSELLDMVTAKESVENLE